MSERKKINTSDLLELVKEDLPHLKSADIKSVYDSILKNAMYGIADGYDLILFGFGTFSTKNKPGGSVILVNTGKTISYDEVPVVRFSCGSVLKSLVRGS